MDRPVDEVRGVWGSAVFAATALVAIPASAAPTATLTLADLRKAVSLASPQISPNGDRVAVLVSRRDYVKDRIETNLDVVDVRTHATRTLVRDARVRAVRWAPDGHAIAYVVEPKSGEDKSAQAFVLPMNGGEPLQLTHEKEGVTDLAWRPDSRALTYVAVAEAPNAKAIEQHDDAFQVTDDAWTAQAAPVPDRLYEIAAGGGTPHRIVSWHWSVAGGFTYSADGRSLFVTRLKPDAHPNRYLASEIVRVSVANGTVSRIAALSSTQADPIRSLDGRFVAYDFANPRASMQTEAALADAGAEHPRFVTRHLNRDVSIEAFAPDGALVLAANDGTRSRLFHVGNDGAIAAYPLGDVDVFAASVAPNGTVALIGATPNHPSELYALPARASAPQRLTHYNGWIGAFALGKSRTITWRSGDGFHPDGVLTAPPHWHAGARAPLVLLIHGGPSATSTMGFNGFAQVLAAHGWFVFEPNYRGSNNLGAEFARTTVPYIASVPGRDIEAGLSAVLSLHLVDTARIGVSGWSEGGLMTSWLIGHDARWKAAVSGAAVNDWIGYSAMTDAKDFTPQFIGRSPWTDPSLMNTFNAESPLTYAMNVKTPTLILSDAGDYRVPTPLSYEFYHDVRATGTPVQFVIFPVNGHFPSDPVRAEDVYRRWEAWLAKYL
jgi:dipeptidyl aminopeptidase/acylaminoacyl peptidase